MSKVSVLVAAYNAAPYIRQCLDSLVNQTLSNIQVVVVDDASTDETFHIVDEYAMKDPRVVCVRLNENGGQAKARNVALGMADGEYVCMVDSDDWLASDALQCASEVLDAHLATGSVLFQVREMYADHVRDYPLPPFSVMSGEEAFEASLTWAIHGLYMVRAEIHKLFPYDDSSRAYSDDNTTRIHFLHSGEVRQCQGWYFYRQHEDSVTHKVSIRRFDYLRANESMRRLMVDSGVEERLLLLYEKVRWLNLVDTYMFYFKNRKSLGREACDYGMKEMRRIWNDIDTRNLPTSLMFKPGYMPLKPFWWLFRMQEEAYFTLRKLVGRL
jgi:glycosyltransferase involved in cell wall biosynthesis